MKKIYIVQSLTFLTMNKLFDIAPSSAILITYYKAKHEYIIRGALLFCGKPTADTTTLPNN